jgi:hypothetical protein
MNIVNTEFPSKHYFKEVRQKKRIVVHHTEGDLPGAGTLRWWQTRNNGAGTVATPWIIRADGDVIKVFDDKYWAYAFGLTLPIAKELERTTVHIELASWGVVVPHPTIPNAFTDDANKKQVFQPAEVISYPEPWRLGYRHFYRYTDAQIKTLVELIRDISLRHGIPVKYAYDTFFPLNTVALSGAPGLYGHTAFRLDKADPHPQPNLIEALAASFA